MGVGELQRECLQQSVFERGLDIDFFDQLFDVFEVFLWTDEKQPIYFEYEISPLGYELPILVPNFGGKFLLKSVPRLIQFQPFRVIP